MDLHETLKLLDLPRGDAYHRSRIPNAYDSRVGRAVAAFSAASPGGQAAIREAIDDDRAGLLRAWSERMAALGVRLESQSPLIQGLVGLSLAQEADAGESLLVAPLHRRSAEKLRLEADRVFAAACGRTDLAGARWLRDARDCDDQPEDAGYIEDSDADGFRYGRAGSSTARSRCPRRLSRVTDPRDPRSHTEVHRVADPESTRVATYLAQRDEVSRVLLLYSGGLDTSVMLKWIQDEYEAEVVALTVNLGQPGEDYEVVKGKAMQLGALDAHVVAAGEEFARDYIAPAIRANADYGDGYPLFTSLGRPLIAKLAVEYARRTGCDTIAHGCTGKGNDQVRIEGTVAT